MGFPMYEVSDLGQVRNKRTGRCMSKSTTDAGYLAVGVCKNGKAKIFLVHRLVALAFLPQPEDSAVVHHINHDRQDARLANLAWVDRQTNNRDRIETIKIVKAAESDQDLPGEIWKQADIKSIRPTFVSSFGRVKHGVFDRVVTGSRVGKEGYCQVLISLADGIRKQFKVHRLVAMCFLPIPSFLATQVNHISGNKQDNRAANLEWVSPSANSQHAYDRVGSKRKLRAVEQNDLDGNKIASFPSLKAACSALGIKGHGLGDACSGRSKTYHGFVWKYAK